MMVLRPDLYPCTLALDTRSPFRGTPVPFLGSLSLHACLIPLVACAVPSTTASVSDYLEHTGTEFEFEFAKLDASTAEEMYDNGRSMMVNK